MVCDPLKGSLYQGRKGFDIPDAADSGVLKDEEIVLYYWDEKQTLHRARRIAYWDRDNGRLFEFITNDFMSPVEKMALI